MRWLIWFIGLGALSLAQPALAQQVPGGGGWVPAAGAAGDNTYQGFIEQPADGATIAAGAAFHVTGWVVDTSAQGWAGIDDVQVLLGSTVLGHAVVGLNRPDVAAATGNPYWAASGFDAVVGGSLPSGTQTLTVLAHTPAKGAWAMTVSVTIGGGSAPITAPSDTSGLVLKIIAPLTNDLIVPNTNGSIYGVAYDTRTRAELGVGVDRIQLYLDGARGVAGSQYLGDAVQNGTQWSLSWAPTHYDSTPHHILYVYARSNVTGEERLVTEELYITR